MKEQTAGRMSPPKMRYPYTPPKIRKLVPEDAVRRLEDEARRGNTGSRDILQRWEELRTTCTALP
jgi:hypothetical protein